jgi:hypothetical protein
LDSERERSSVDRIDVGDLVVGLAANQHRPSVTPIDVRYPSDNDNPYGLSAPSGNAGSASFVIVRLSRWRSLGKRAGPGAPPTGQQRRCDASVIAVA